MSAIHDLADRIETSLKVTDAADMDIRWRMDRDAAAAFAEMLRKTAKLIKEHDRMRAALQRIADDDVDADLKGRPDILSGIAWAALETSQHDNDDGAVSPSLFRVDQ